MKEKLLKDKSWKALSLMWVNLEAIWSESKEDSKAERLKDRPKNLGGCLIWGLKSAKGVSESHLVMSDLCNPMDSPGENTGVGSLSLLQGIFPTQGLNTGLPHCRWMFYQLSHKGSPRILEWVAYPFSSVSSRSRDQTGVSCIADRFFTNRAIREALRVYMGCGKF